MRNLILFVILLASFGASAQTSSSIGTIVNPRGFWAPENKLTNPDWEKATTSWTASGGTYTRTTTASQIGRGVGAASWDSSASGQTLSSNTVSLTTNSLTNKSVTFSCLIKAASGTATHTLQIYDGTNVLADSGTIVSSTTQWVRQSVTTVAGSSGTIRGRIISVASNEPQIFIDDCYFGASDGAIFSQVSQSTFFGSLSYAAASSCQWIITQASYAADFSADTDCSTPTVTGSLSAPSTKVPGFDAVMPPGNYMIVATGFSTSFSSNTPNYGIFDGSTQLSSSNGSGSTGTGVVTLIAPLNVTTTASKQIRIRASAAAGNAVVDDSVASGTLTFNVYKFPASSDVIFRPDTIANSWAGYHSSDCEWTTTSASFVDPSADASCTFTERVNNNFGTVTSSGSKTPGIVFTPSRVGTYYVCAKNLAYVNNAAMHTRLTDGTTVISETATHATTTGVVHNMINCGLYRATSLSPVTLKIQMFVSSGTMFMSSPAADSNTIEWSIFQIDQKLPAPVLTGSVVSDTNAVEKSNRASISNTGVVTNESGDWISGSCAVSGGSSNVYTCTLNAGVFSATPVCVGSISAGGNGEIVGGAASSTSVVFTTYASSGTGSDRSFNLICMGPK